MGRFDFSGKRVLVTGASAGIGRALAAQFAQRKAHLALGSLPTEADVLEAHATELRARHGVDVLTFPVDLLGPGGPERLHREVTERFGAVFALVNNAGTVAYGPYQDVPWEAQETIMRLNLLVPMRLMHLFLQDMVRRREGVVFNVSSVSALQPTPFQASYGASKAGLQSLSQAVRAELKGTGVTVCTLNPPYIDTRLLRTPGYPEDLRFYRISGKKSPEWLAQKAIAAFEEGKMIYIPGLLNRIIHDLLVRISPRPLVDAFSRYFLQGSSGARTTKR